MMRTTCDNGYDSTLHGLIWQNGEASLMPVKVYHDECGDLFHLCDDCGKRERGMFLVTPDTTITRVQFTEDGRELVNHYAASIAELMPHYIPTGAGWITTVIAGEYALTVVQTFNGKAMGTTTFTQAKGL